MVHARIMLITAHAAIITIIHHVIIDSVTSIPLKIVAITVSLMEIARIVTEQEIILLVGTMGLDLIPTKRACARSMSSSTLNTNEGAIRTGPTKQDIVQITAKALNITTHAHNTGTVINTEVGNDANLIAILDRLAVSIAINNKAMNLTEKADSLTVMIAISDLFETIHGLVHKTRVGRVVQQDNVAIIQADRKNLPGAGQNGSYSKATMSILRQVTLHEPI